MIPIGVTKPTPLKSLAGLPRPHGNLDIPSRRGPAQRIARPRNRNPIKRRPPKPLPQATRHTNLQISSSRILRNGLPNLTRRSRFQIPFAELHFGQEAMRPMVPVERDRRKREKHHAQLFHRCLGTGFANSIPVGSGSGTIFVTGSRRNPRCRP
jgi:hypothetical protein